MRIRDWSSDVVSSDLPCGCRTCWPAIGHWIGRARMNPQDLERLVTREMPFGKYQGRLIADLPGPYLAWFARKGFPPGEIGRLLALMHELDHNGLAGLLQPQIGRAHV